MIGFIWVMDDLEIRGLDVDWLMFGFALYAGLTMVTNVPFYSFKDVQMKKRVPFVVIVAIALGIAVINVHPPIVLFGAVRASTACRATWSMAGAGPRASRSA